MLLLIVILILIGSAGILGNIYFNIFSFQKNYLDLNNYYNSIYGSISSVERALISSKYTGPGFIGSGGFLSTGNWGSISDLFSGDFGKFTANTNGIYWSSNSKTQKIEGILNYNDILTIILSTSIGDDIYSGTNKDYSFFIDKNQISGYINILNFESIKNHNDTQVKWIIKTNNDGEYIIGDGLGNHILNNDINNGSTIYFGSGIYNIFDSLAYIGSGFLTLGSSYTGNINDALNGGYATGLNFYITGGYLINSNGIVPHLFYHFESNTSFSDLYYNLTGTAIIGNYKKEIFIKKPTSIYQNPQTFIFPYYE